MALLSLARMRYQRALSWCYKPERMLLLLLNILCATLIGLAVHLHSIE
jgi:hypothetical protein